MKVNEFLDTLSKISGILVVVFLIAIIVALIMIFVFSRKKKLLKKPTIFLIISILFFALFSFSYKKSSDALLKYHFDKYVDEFNDSISKVD